MRGMLVAAARVIALAIGAAWAIAGHRSPGAPTGAAPQQSGIWRMAKAWTFRAIVILGILGVGGVIVVLSGVVPIKASSGHWAITAWFLDFAKARSVATHTLRTRVPPLDEPHQVLKGAGHYDFACRPCHGSPGLAQPRIARQMTPRPPDLRESVPQFDPASLFYIVKHGIKLTGMPAWPALNRDDEVWAMVSFLRKLPELSAEEYDRLANGPVGNSPRVAMERLVPPAEVPEAVTDSCARCHGVDGLGRRTGAFPVLAGQRFAYLRATLEAYARGLRHSGIMEPVASVLGPDEIATVAEYYARLDPAPVPGAPIAGDAIERGRRIAEQGRPNELVPPCLSCHGPGELRRNPHYPKLAGQYAEYLRLQLSLFKKKIRGGSPYHRIMMRVAGQLSDEDIHDVAAFFASLPATTARQP